MKRRALLLALALFVSACGARPPALPMTSVPAAPFLQALRKHNASFVSLTAIAEIELLVRGQRRIFETVAIAVDRQQRFRIEAFGPFNQSIMALVWDGKEIFARLPGETSVSRPGLAGLQRLLGQGVTPNDICAMLAGSIPDVSDQSNLDARCAAEGRCMLTIGDSSAEKRIWLRSESDPDRFHLLSISMNQFGRLRYEMQFDRMAEIALYRLPMQLTLEDPDRNQRVTIRYREIDINVPLHEDAFMLQGDSAATSQETLPMLPE